MFVIKDTALPEWVGRGDLVICRYTAPLVQHCLALLRRQIPAVVLGKDIAKRILRIAEELFPRGLHNWRNVLRAYRATEETRIQRDAANDNEAERETIILHDLLDSVGILIAEVVTRGGTTVEHLTDYVTRFFSDDHGAPIIFSTVHKAKGKEADRVFILHPENMPAVYARTDTAARGEACVQFVALTRAKKELIFVEETRPASRGRLGA